MDRLQSNDMENEHWNIFETVVFPTRTRQKNVTIYMILSLSLFSKHNFNLLGGGFTNEIKLYSWISFGNKIP